MTTRGMVLSGTTHSHFEGAFISRAPRLSLALIVGIITLGGTSHPVQASHPVPSATVVQSNLVVPWDLDFTPDGRMVVTERPGRIRVYASGAANAPVLSTTEVEFARPVHESGVNGVAVDRDFGAHPYIYVCASRDEDGATGPMPWVNEILKYPINANGTLGAYTVLPGIAAAANTQHNGCSVEMDAAGRLWIGIGDGGVPFAAQDPASLNGKILRINRDGSIPSDNPTLPGTTGPTAVFSMGHRNPQGIAFAPGNGQAYAVEHGPSVNDEMNMLVSGGNYGWPCFTGAASPHMTDDRCGEASSYLAPVWASGAPTIATSGFTFLDHESWGSWNGSAIVAQLKEQDLRRFAPSGGSAITELDRFLDGMHGRLRAAVQAPDGALYVTTSNGTGDQVLRIVPGEVPVDRLQGADRYATSAQISAQTFAAGVPTVYVATGANYPDALAGGAAAARDDAPVLLVTRDGIPAATAAELDRLNPYRIVVLGGTGVVSASVQQALAGYAAGGGTLRLAGADRYATAAAISRATFAASVPVAYIATGTNYPDALSGVPAAGLHGGPILLVDLKGIPAPTRGELERLQPQRIVVLGGPGAVPNRIVTDLQGYTLGAVERRSGADRYATAIATSQATFGPRVDRVFIATGLNFPDGLSGGPAAALSGGPLLLVPGSSVPDVVRAELLRLDPDRVTLLGGTGVLSESVAAEISDLLND